LTLLLWHARKRSRDSHFERGPTTLEISAHVPPHARWGITLTRAHTSPCNSVRSCVVCLDKQILFLCHVGAELPRKLLSFLRTPSLLPSYFGMFFELAFDAMKQTQRGHTHIALWPTDIPHTRLPPRALTLGPVFLISCVPPVWYSPSRLRVNPRGISSCGARCTNSVHTEQLGVAAAIADRCAAPSLVVVETEVSNESHYWRLPPASARLPTHMAGPVACLDSLRSLNSRTPLLSGSREWVQATQAGDAEQPQCISPGRHLSTRLIGSIKADPMTVLQPHETGSCALISVQDGQRHVRRLLAASRGCPPRTHAAAPRGCIGRVWVPQGLL